MTPAARRREVTAADLFCGAGGTSEGLARACAAAGRPLRLIAVNHWQIAIDTHRRNHPEATHVCAALEGLNPRDLVPSGRLNLLVASPECTNHSVARGGRPINDQSRASAWLILKWLQELYVENVLIENVAEFEWWAPLGANGKPLKSRRGELFQQFIATIRAMDYTLEYRKLRAANYGDPTTRERLFIMAKRGRNKRIPWPEATHAQSGKTANLFGDLKPWRSAREIIDWSLEGTSIFHRKRPLAEKTLKRILAGMQKFQWPEPFIITLRQHLAARSVNEPIPTVTAGGSHIGLVEPVAFVLQQQSNGAPRSVDDPVPTVATAGKISLIEPFTVPMNHKRDRLRSVGEPVQTVTATSSDIGVVSPFMIPYRGERLGQAPRTHAIDEPMPAVTTERGHALVEPFMVTASHGDSGKRAGRSVDEPLLTVTGSNDHAVVEPMVVRFDHQGRESRARSIDSPLPTITTKNGLGVVTPLIVPQFGEGAAKSVDDPLGTVTTTSRGIGLARPFVAELRNGKTANSIEEPLSTVTTIGAHHGIVEPAFLAKYYGEGVCASVDDPLDTVTAKARFGLCRVGETVYDVHFRMLRPRELARAQGFPDRYEFPPQSAVATKLIGNAVPTGLAEALCAELIA